MRRGRGFTLIEIVVAVAVIATAMGAILSAMARHASNAAYLRDKTLALWVAHNRLTELELEPAWPDIGTSNGEEPMGGVAWAWELEVSETPDPNVRRLDIRVGLEKGPEGLAALSAFLSSAGRQARAP